MALVKMRPRSLRRIQRSARTPPASAPTMAASCQYSVADTPAWPWPMPNCCFRIAGIQSRTTQPASAGSVK